MEGEPGNPLARLVLPATVVGWVGLLILTNPTGEFALQDDWSYARTVESLLEDGEFRPTGWSALPLLTQVLWGALFCLPFGFSFAALRASTACLGAIGLVATWALLREMGASRRTAWVGTALLAVNPMYLHLSLSFMTDVPFTALALASLAVLLRAERVRSPWLWAAGLGLAVAATLIRQLGLAVPIAFACAIVLRDGPRLRPILRGLLGIGLAIGALVALNAYIAHHGGFPKQHDFRIGGVGRILAHGPGAVAMRMLGHTLDVITEVGFWLAPFLVVGAVGVGRALSRPARWTAGLAALAFVSVQSWRLFSETRLMPLSGGTIYGHGVGPLTLRDSGLLWIPRWPEVLDGAWWVLTDIGLLGGGVLVGLVAAGVVGILRRHVDRPRAARLALLVVATAAYLTPFVLTTYLDRYELFLLPLGAAVLVWWMAPRVRPGRFAMVAASLVLAVVALWSTAATRDYLAWSRARFDLARELVEERGVSPTRLDGGFEVNGWYLYSPDYEKRRGKSFWWVEDDEYMIAFGSLPGYRIVDERVLARWLPPGEIRVVLLERVR